MEIEKTMCDRVGKDYYDLLEQMVVILRHFPDTYYYLDDKSLDKISNLSLKLQTGECEIIEFKNQICKFNVEEKIKEEVDKTKNEKDEEINRLNNIIDKAIEFIDKYCIDDEFYINLTYKEKAIIEVKKILQGVDE